jgi:hypothetical protein
MKFVVRAFVLALVVTGAAATTMTASTSAQNNKVVATRVSLLPVPSCAPDDPNACGMALGAHH